MLYIYDKKQFTNKKEREGNSMPAVIARLNSPVKNDGGRDVIYFESSIDAVIDHTSGKSVRELIEERTYPEATETSSGLLSFTDKQHLEEIYRQMIIISDVNPEKPCQWFQLRSSSYELINSGSSVPTTPKKAYFYEYVTATSKWKRVTALDSLIQSVTESLGRHDFVLKKKADTVSGTTYISEFGGTFIPLVRYAVNNTCTISMTETQDQEIDGKKASTITVVVANIDMASIQTQKTYSLALMLLEEGQTPPTV